MTPIDFPESNTVFGPPPDFTESQVLPIPAWQGNVPGGSCDGQPFVVVAWKPDAAELEVLNSGGAIFLSMFGGLAPHMLTTDFKQATHPA